MTIYKIHRQQLVKAPIDKIWDFFSSPKNLADITPKKMNFRITSGELPDNIYPGQIITYTLSPILGISLSWMTEITHIEYHKLFVDEQRSGPYKLWHHEHHFKENNEGILMTDIVHYALPLSILGNMAHSLFVKKQLNDLFDFRYKKVEELFNQTQFK